jgi:hypothetical protein
VLIVEARMYRCSYDNQRLEDVSDIVINASVTMDTDREETWTLDCTVTWAGWQRLRPYYDWLAPCLQVTYPDGTVRGGFDTRGQLGHYMVLPSLKRHRETDAQVVLEAGDPLWLFGNGYIHGGSQGLLIAQPGLKKTRAVKQLLDSAVLTDTPSGRRLYAIPDRNEEFKRRKEWDADMSKLEVCNQILQGAGCLPLWTTKTGIITTKAAGEARLRQRHPVRTFSANVPADVELPRLQRPLGGVPSDVIGEVVETPKGADLTNEIQLVNDAPDGNKLRVRGRITHPRNPRSVFHRSGRKKVKTIKNPVLDDDATAEEVARALLDELSTLNSTIRMQVVPDPEPDFARETINCLIWNVAGEEIANGQYAVHRVQYGFTPGTATMTIDCGRVDDADDLLLDDVA